MKNTHIANAQQYSVANVSDSPSFDDHEQVSFIEDADTGLKAIIAIHNTTLGPSVGGCRMYPYNSKEDALEDALRLSRSMTYKSAMAGLPMGGGKSVIIGNPQVHKSPALFKAMAEFINQHQGSYISAEDSGTSVADMQLMNESTEYVLGHEPGTEYGGDPSPFTARGVFNAMQAAAGYRFGSDDLAGLSIAIQGVGSVGLNLCRDLIEVGAKVTVADNNQRSLKKAQSLGASVTAADEIHRVPADIFSPCAMGGVLNDQSIPNLSASIIVGAANNQLANHYHARVLRKRGVLYAPDFVVNAGGIIDVYRQLKSATTEQVQQKVMAINATLTEILTLSDEQDLDTQTIAEQLAEKRFVDNNKKDDSVAA